MTSASEAKGEIIGIHSSRIDLERYTQGAVVLENFITKAPARPGIIHHLCSAWGRIMP